MKGILINNGKALGDGSGKVFTVQSEKGNPVTVYTEGEMNSLIISENVDKIFKYIGDDGEYTKDHIYQVVDENGTLTIKDLSMGIALPPVTNINLSSGGVLYWDKPDMSNIDSNFTFISISYEIEFNGASFTSDKENVNVYSNIVEGENTASVKAIGVFKFNVNNKEQEVLLEYTTPQELAIFILGEKLPTGRSNSFSALVGTNAYVFGGRNSSYLREILKFDASTETITILETKLPDASECALSIAVGSAIYIFGGGYTSTSFSSIWKFDTISETVTVLDAKLPNARKYMVGGLVGNIIYMFGGQTQSYTGNDTSYNDVIKFDTATETIIETLPNILTQNWYSKSKAVVIDTNIYFIYRYNFGKFDTTTETFTTIPVSHYNSTSSDSTIEAFGTNIYTFGGKDNMQKPVREIYKIDTVSETRTLLEAVLPVDLFEFTSVIVGNTVYIFGGKSATFTYSDEILKVINLS